MTTDLVPSITYNGSDIQRFWIAISALGMKPMTLTLFSSPNKVTLIPLLASTFNLSFLMRSSEMIHTEAPISIKVGKDIPAILIYTFNDCNNFYCLNVKA